MKLREIGSVAGVTLLVGFFPSTQALGHHSFAANFLMNEEISIEAVVTGVRIANPHSLIFVDSVNESGETEAWTVETGTPTVVRRAGWTSKTLPVGTKVTIFGHPTRSGAPTLALTRIVLEDGSELQAPGRE